MTAAAVKADATLVPTPCQYCRQTFCVTKSAAANSSVNRDDMLENKGKAADGYYCFEMDRARMDFMQYWRTADFASMGMTATGKAMWEVNYVAGRAVNRVGLAVDAKENQGPANPYNNQAAIFPSAGTTSSIVPPLLHAPRATPGIDAVGVGGYATLATVGRLPTLAPGKAVLSVSWYQPKWQKNDYYQYNFRINYADSVQVKYCTHNAAASFGSVYATAAAANKAVGSAGYPWFTGMLAPAQPTGTTAADVRASTCTWASGVATATAGPKDGASALMASVTALALGAAALAF